MLALLTTSRPGRGQTKLFRLVTAALISCGLGLFLPQSARAQNNITPESGLYHNASQPGRGFSLERNSADRVFMAVYGYEDGGTGRAIWMAATLNRAPGTNQFSGDLVHVTNGQALGGPIVPNPTVTNRGPISLTFTSATAARLTWPASFGPAPAVDLVRYPVNGQAVLPPAAGSAAPTGWWTNVNQAGRGYFTEMQGNTLFFAGYMSRTNGSAVWYVASGPMQSNTTFNSTLTEFAGGPGFLTPTRTNAAAIPTVNNVVNITFHSAAEATFTVGGTAFFVTRYNF